MFKAFWAAILLILIAAPATLVAEERYLVSYAGFQAPVWAAKDFGLFAKYGLSTDLVMIPGSARGTQALLAGSTPLRGNRGPPPKFAIKQRAGLVLLPPTL